MNSVKFYLQPGRVPRVLNGQIYDTRACVQLSDIQHFATEQEHEYGTSFAPC